MATGATPGRDCTPPPALRTAAMSPSAMTSGWPGSVRSGSTVTRPARSTSAPAASPSIPASPEARTPAAHTTVRAAIRSLEPSGACSVTDSGSMPTTVRLSIGVAPMRSSERAAFADSDSGNVVSRRSAVSTSSTRAPVGSIRRKSPRSVSRASSPIWPAISTPVGPPPTTTKVSWAACSAGSSIISARSNALSSRERTVIADSSDLTSAACSRHSSWPKYE